MTGAIGVYTEYPTDLITNVHFKKKGPPPGPCVPSPIICQNVYGYGAKVTMFNAHDVIFTDALAYGPNQFPPFVGESFALNGSNGPGGIYGGPAHIYEETTGTAGPFPDWFAQQILLTESSMFFFNGQRYTDPFNNQLEPLFWAVPMAQGSECPGPIPIVAKTYTIRVAWSTSSSSTNSVGIGLSHPRTTNYDDNPGGVPLAPEVPQFILGSMGGGSGVVEYDFHWKEWAQALFSSSYTIDATNEYDLNQPGPVYLWWMFQDRDGNWVTVTGASSVPSRGWTGFMNFAVFGLGDWYTWEISATCEPEPTF